MKAFISILLCIFLSACATTPAPESTPEPGPEPTPEDREITTLATGELSALGLILEGQSLGEDLVWMDEIVKGPKHWQENLDNGDQPLVPGCACSYQLPNCGGAITGRAVDECFPRGGGQQILQEKTVPKANCGNYGNKQYDCEQLLGKGATCRVVPITCCGVSTTSAYCHLEL